MLVLDASFSSSLFRPYCQALGQCAEYVRRNFPNAKTYPTSSTGVAVEMLLDETSDEYGHRAAIASESFAKNPEVEIIGRAIQDMNGLSLLLLSSSTGFLRSGFLTLVGRSTPN